VAAAEAAAARLAMAFWDARRQFLPEGTSLLKAAAAVAEAAAHAAANDTVVAIGDGADATTSGAPGDSTWLLQELLKHSWRYGTTTVSGFIYVPFWLTLTLIWCLPTHHGWSLLNLSGSEVFAANKRVWVCDAVVISFST
jgi:hypothetical protein